MIIPFPNKNESCCSSKKSHIVLPVCPKSNFRLRFTADENAARPVPAEGAFTWLKDLQKNGPKFDSIEIAGPGDPLATAEQIFEITKMISHDYPEVKITLSTVGIHGQQHAAEISALGITDITVKVDAVDPAIIQKIYAWIRPAKKTVPIKHASEILVSEQADTVKAFKEQGIAVNILSTVYPGINDDHVESIAKTMASYGAESMTISPFKPVGSTETEMPNEADDELMEQLREKVFPYFPNVSITKQNSNNKPLCSSPSVTCIPNRVMLPKPSKQRPNVAVVSSNGMEIDLHLGQAYQVLVYGPREDGLPCLLGARPAPEPGGGGSRWEALASVLSDCFALLCASAGENPKKIMGQNGISVLTQEGEIEGTVDVLFGGGKKGKRK